jgi:hypothetical protein
MSGKTVLTFRDGSYQLQLSLSIGDVILKLESSDGDCRDRYCADVTVASKRFVV